MHTHHQLRRKLFIACLAIVACGGNTVSSDEQARRAYLGLDKAISKCLTLGFAGFNAAKSANIPAQETTGDKTGTLEITGQVDQGASANKGMRLKVGMSGYSDGDIVPDAGAPLRVTYETVDAGTPLPALDLNMKNIPNGTLTGTLVGDFHMAGDLTGSVKLNLSLSGTIESDGAGGTRRKAGDTTVTGTATSGAGNYSINLKL